jgi:protein SCO1/2
MRSRSIALVVVVGAVVAAACGSGETTPVLAELDPAVSHDLATPSILGNSVADVVLPDVSSAGAEFTMRAEPGHALMVYFGFTSCPDVCPTTLADVKSAIADLDDTAERVQFAMVTIDPERDFDETLIAYVSAFVPSGHALRTTDDVVLRAAADAFAADYSVIKSDDAVDVLHTAYLYAIDDAGTIRIVWPFGAEPDRIASDLTEMLAGT